METPKQLSVSQSQTAVLHVYAKPEQTLTTLNTSKPLVREKGETGDGGCGSQRPEKILAKFNMSKPLVREGELRDVGVVDRGPEKTLPMLNTSKPLVREGAKSGKWVW